MNLASLLSNGIFFALKSADADNVVSDIRLVEDKGNDDVDTDGVNKWYVGKGGDGDGECVALMAGLRMLVRKSCASTPMI